ncbi:MAG: flagellin [Tissierellaceae bacterium]|jgi:flagellin|nr:flagellin [Tissierellaceae bacterium]
MRINNNMMAMNAHRQLSINNDSVAKSLEKLSSGYRINRAGDDAAGLAISEKMRGQIRGLNMASKNAQDGISFIQTAEGGLNESHSILQRMRELAVQSANDTNVNVDRGEIQKEMDQLASELTRISNDTEYNTQTLLNGGIDGVNFQIGANENQSIKLSINAMDAKSLGVAADKKVGEVTSGGTNDGITGVTVSNTTSLSGEQGITVVSGTSGEGTLGQLKFSVGSNDVWVDKAATKVEFKDLGITLTKDASKTTAEDFKNAKINITKIEAKAADADAGQKAVAEAGVDVSSFGSAEKAITTIQSAIETVSAERSKLGALQNRFEHTIKNLDNTAENLQSAESRIRDVDMAKEMMEFTKQNILSQAANAMLAQANQAPQTVLQLLK